MSGKLRRMGDGRGVESDVWRGSFGWGGGMGNRTDSLSFVDTGDY